MTTYNLFAQAAPGGTINPGTGNSGTNGIHFTVSSSATLSGVWHWSSSSDTQLPVTIGLYTVTTLGTSGSLVHSEGTTASPISWSGAAGSGWVLATFASPPSLTASTSYMAVKFRNDGANRWFSYYSVTWPVTSGIVTAPKDESTSALSQGWYNTGTALAFPATQTSTAGDNFGMDVQVTAATTHSGGASLSGTGSLSAGGHKTVPGAASLSGTGTLTPTGNGRSQFTWPFSYDSVWNLPIAATAAYAATGITVTSDYSTDASAVEYCCTDPAQPVKSLTNAELAGGSTGAANVYVYPGMSAPGTWNDCAALLGTDNDTVYQGQTLDLTAGGNPSFGGDADSTSAVVSLKSTGITGSHGGSGLSALGGTLTVADLTGSLPIRHAMKVCFNGLLYYSSAGTGFQWPAVSADGGYATSGNVNFYGGSNPDIVLGALLALPPWLSPSKYSDPLVQKIATAMQNYGCYIVDNTASGAGVSDSLIELNFDAVSDFTGSGTFSSDFHQMLEDLRVVTNSASGTPGGGSIGANRFAPYAPPFNDGTSVPPALTVVTPQSVLMQSLQDAFPGSTLNAQWGDYGTVTVGSNQCSIAAGTSESGIYASSGFMLTGSYMLAKVTPYTGGSGGYTYFQAVAEVGSGGAGIQFNTGSIWAYWVNSGGTVTNLTSLTYDPVAHAWWRVREDPSTGTTYMDTSPDGATWTNRWSVADPIAYNSMMAQVGSAISSGTAGTTTVADFNLPSASGAASLSGSGSLSAAGAAAAPGAASLSGTGSVTSAGHKTVPGTASLSGTGSVTAAGSKSVPGAAALSGTGTSSGTAAKTVPGAAVLAGQGTVTAAGTEKIPGGASLSGQGSASAAGILVVQGSAVLSGTGSVAGTAAKSVPGAASLSGTGSVTAAWQLAGSASLSGTGSLTAAGRRTVPGAAALSGQGSAAASGAKEIPGAAVLSGTGSPAAAGQKSIPGAAALAGAGTLSGTAQETSAGAASLEGEGALLAASGAVTHAAAALAGSGSASAAGQKTVPGAAGLSGAGQATTAGTAVLLASAPLSGTGSLGSAARKTVPGAASLSGSGAAAASAAVTVTGAAALSGTGLAVLTGGFLYLPGSASLNGSGLLGGSASRKAAGAALLSGSGSAAAAGEAVVRGAAVLSGSGSASGAPAGFSAGAASLAGTGSLGAAGFLAVRSAAALAALAEVTALGFISKTGTAHLAAGGTLVSGPVVLRHGGASLEARPVLFASAFNRLGTVSLAAPAALACTASAGPDLDAMWASYQDLEHAAARAREAWRMMHQAGGTDGTAGFLYGRVYEAERQADTAYSAFLSARERVTPGAAG